MAVIIKLSKTGKRVIMEIQTDPLNDRIAVGCHANVLPRETAVEKECKLGYLDL